MLVAAWRASPRGGPARLPPPRPPPAPAPRAPSTPRRPPPPPPRPLLRDPCLDSGLPGGDLAGAGLEPLAHDHVIHVLAFDAGPLESGADGVGTQAHRRDFLECTTKLGDGGARAR